jgi:ubiquitin-like 1-activating enzyme E1 B
VFTKVYDQDIRRLLAMSDMWQYRVPPVPLDRKAILTDSFVDSRKGDAINGHKNAAPPQTNGGNSQAGSGLKDQKALSLRDNVELLDDRYAFKALLFAYLLNCVGL